MIPVELITMAGGATMGGLFKMIDKAQEAKAKQQEFCLLYTSPSPRDS